MKQVSTRAGLIMATFAISLIALAGPAKHAAPAKKGTWHIKADYIEACSCNLFCQCYFATRPEGEAFCEFNNAVHIVKGNVGDVNLDNTYVWLSGDLGGDFSKGQMKGAVITFNKGTTKKQKDAIVFLIQKVYPVKWESIKMDEAPITWKRTGNNGYAKLGDKGEVKLVGNKGSNGKPSVIKNLVYWGAHKNDGFELAYSTHHYKGNGYDYSHKNKNGFFITIESSGKM
ncbi:MAG: DUF1326 domain-containing protein [Armatimonadetes bacterium]|nr:DUF1326 domain-containing protein [Armatimonadota bacterium]